MHRHPGGLVVWVLLARTAARCPKTRRSAMHQHWRLRSPWVGPRVRARTRRPHRQAAVGLTNPTALRVAPSSEKRLLDHHYPSECDTTGGAEGAKVPDIAAGKFVRFTQLNRSGELKMVADG